MTGVAALFQPNVGGDFSSLNISAATVVKATPGTLVTISVITAGSAPGAIYDSISTSGNTAADQVASIPNTVGIYEAYRFPCFNGIVVAPGTGQVVSISYS